MEDDDLSRIKYRYNNLDLLRSLCCVLVILIHVSGLFSKEWCIEQGLDYRSFDYMIANLWLTPGRIAVPIFTMISGAFSLSGDADIHPLQYYKKTFKKIVIPTLLASVFYIIYRSMVDIIINGNNWYVLLKNTVVMFIEPFNHLWYAYMIVGWYIVVPVMIMLKKKLAETAWFYKLSICLMVFGIIVNFTSELHWTLKFVPFLGYFTLGAVLKEKFDAIKLSRNEQRLYGVVGIVMLLLIFLEYQIKDYFMLFKQTYIGNCFDLFVIFGSIAIYIYFLSMDLQSERFWVFSNKSFYIYLAHYGVMLVLDNVLNAFLPIIGCGISPIWYIPLLTSLVLIISYVFTFPFGGIVHTINKNILPKQ